MNTDSVKIFGSVLMGILLAMVVTLTPFACQGLINPISAADKAFIKAVSEDVKLLKTKVVAVEQRIENEEKVIVNKIDKEAITLIDEDIAELRKLTCGCDQNKFCRCGDNPGFVPTQSWYQSSTNPNIYLYGYVKDGILHYSYIFYVNKNVVVPAIKSPLANAVGPNNTGGNITKDFIPVVVGGLPNP